MILRLLVIKDLGIEIILIAICQQESALPRRPRRSEIRIIVGLNALAKESQFARSILQRSGVLLLSQTMVAIGAHCRRIGIEFFAVGGRHIASPIGKIQPKALLALEIDFHLNLVIVLLHCGNAKLSTLGARRHNDRICILIKTIVGIVRGRIAVAQMKVALQQARWPIILHALSDGVEASIEAVVLDVLHGIREKQERIGLRAQSASWRNRNRLRKRFIPGSDEIACQVVICSAIGRQQIDLGGLRFSQCRRSFEESKGFRGSARLSLHADKIVGQWNLIESGATRTGESIKCVQDLRNGDSAQIRVNQCSAFFDDRVP